MLSQCTVALTRWQGNAQQPLLGTLVTFLCTALQATSFPPALFVYFQHGLSVVFLDVLAHISMRAVQTEA